MPERLDRAPSLTIDRARALLLAIRAEFPPNTCSHDGWHDFRRHALSHAEALSRRGAIELRTCSFDGRAFVAQRTPRATMCSVRLRALTADPRCSMMQVI